MQSLWPLFFLAALGPARLYDVTVETGMPHLEENLRYATTDGERCLARSDLASVFPILDHPSLAGCKLREQSSDANTVVYVLVCDSDTTGTATWHLGEHVIRGTLDVKLGGKSMTFFQRVTATAIGDCPLVGRSRRSQSANKRLYFQVSTAARNGEELRPIHDAAWSLSTPTTWPGRVDSSKAAP